MRRLNKRERADVFVNDRRTRRKGFGRWVYLGILGLMAAIGLNYLMGDMLFFRAEGMVLQDRADIEAVFVGRLDEISVRIGQRVEQSDNVATLNSVDIVEKLASMSLRITELTQRSLENEERNFVAHEMLPLAAERETLAREHKENLSTLRQKGVVSSAAFHDANQQYYVAEENVTRLNAVTSRSDALHETALFALANARRSFDNLAEIYQNGEILAPVSGVVGSAVPSKGEVLLQGDRIISIYHGPKYALVYLPNRHLFSIATGDHVVLDAGRHSTTGRIDQILPVSDALPPEFQDTFRPQERSQLARIEIDGSQDIPLHSKLNVYKEFNLLDSLSMRLAEMLDFFEQRFA